MRGRYVNVLRGPSVPMLLTGPSWLEPAARQAQGKEHGSPRAVCKCQVSPHYNAYLNYSSQLMLFQRERFLQSTPSLRKVRTLLVVSW